MKHKIVFVFLFVLSACIPLPAIPPIPTPTPLITPTPSITPTPIIIPSPEPVPEKCNLEQPIEPKSCEYNPSGAPLFRDDVFRAQDLAALAGFVDDSGKVLDEVAYTQEVSKNLRKMGYCSIAGQRDEVWLKKDNSVSEHYDIVRSDQMMMNLFAAKCKPAFF